MVTIGSLILLVTLLIVIYQDFKERLMSWWLLPVLFVALVMLRSVDSFMGSLTDVAINWSFLLLQYLLLSLYFSVKEKKLVQIANQYVGWGDLWFLLVMGLAFSPVHFIMVFVTGLVFSLFLYSILKAVKIIAKPSVPLAGLFSIYLIFVQLAAYFAHYNLLSDEQLISQIYSVHV